MSEPTPDPNPEVWELRAKLAHAEGKIEGMVIGAQYMARDLERAERAVVALCRANSELGLLLVEKMAQNAEPTVVQL